MSTLNLTAVRPTVQAQFLTSAEAASLCGCSFMTINRAFDAGELSGHKLASGHRRVERSSLIEWAGLPADEQPTDDTPADWDRIIAIYARCSTDKQGQNLVRQIERLKAYVERTYPGERYVVYSEIASGLNCDRRCLNKVIDLALAGKVARVVIEFSERLSRGSFGMLSRIFGKCGVEIVVTREGEQENQGKTLTDELIFDCMAMMSCVNAKIYGQRASLKVRWVAPKGLAERVATLYGQGLSRRAILTALRKEGWKCANSGRLISQWGYRKVMRDINASLPERKTVAAEKTAGPVPQYVAEFVRSRCKVGAGKRVLTRELWAAFTESNPAEAANLSKRKFTDLLKTCVKHGFMERQSGAHIFHGISLKAA
jgi:putative resolvase